MDRELIPHRLKLRKQSTSLRELVSQPQTTPNHNPGDPYTPGFVVHRLLKLRVGFLDPYSVYSTLQCTGLSYLAWVLTFYTILTLGSLLWPRLLTLTTQCHLGSISWVQV